MNGVLVARALGGGRGDPQRARDGLLNVLRADGLGFAPGAPARLGLLRRTR